MILLLTGTSPYGFERLVKAVDELADRNSWQVFVQLGFTRHQPENCNYKRFLNHEDMLKRIDQADVVICHGGFGSIRDVLALGKVPVVVPREPEKGESPDYQIDLVRQLDHEGRIIAAYDVKDLAVCIRRATGIVAAAADTSRIPAMIQDYLDGL